MKTLEQSQISIVAGGLHFPTPIQTSSRKHQLPSIMDMLGDCEECAEALVSYTVFRVLGIGVSIEQSFKNAFGH